MSEKRAATDENALERGGMEAGEAAAAASASRAKVLVVEDETQIADFVAQALRNEGYSAVTAGSLKDGLRECTLGRPDLLIVDLGLPDGDGTSLISAARRFSSMPIIIVSARTEEAQKIRALDLGADDYLTKPFSMPELTARVRAQMRRRFLADRPTPERKVRIGDVAVDLEARSVTKAGEPVHLTKIEYRLLSYLIASRGKVLTQRQLLVEVWGPPYVDRPHYLRIYMQRLRTKLEDMPARPKWFITEIGVGYRLAVDASAPEGAEEA